MSLTQSEGPLLGKTVAVLVANGFAETQFTAPQKALIAAGAQVKLISNEQGLVNGWHDTAWGHYFPVDAPIEDVLGADFDMLLLPGGYRSVDKLSQTQHTARIIKSIMDANKPVAAIGDGVALLAVAERAQGRRLTCAPEAVERLQEAGAKLATEEELVVDGSVLTATGAEALEGFVDRVIEHFADQSLQDAA